MAKTTLKYQEREFVFEAHPDLRGAMIEYMMYEVVRPTWKFFRTTYRKGGSFWTADYPTIMEGLKNVLAHYLADEVEEEENRKKFAEFEKGA